MSQWAPGVRDRCRRGCTNDGEAGASPFVNRHVPFLIVGLSAAALQGAPVATQELTLGDVVTRVLPLTRILASKRAADRPKDRLVGPVLEEVVALQAARSDAPR